MLLHQTFEQSASRYPDKIALVCGSQSYSYAALLVKCHALAAQLEARGVSRGDRVAIFMPNSVDAVASIYATLMIGAVFMPINPQTKSEKLRFILRDARAAALLADAALAPVYEPALADGPSECTLILPVDAAEAHCEPAVLPDDGGAIDEDLAAIIYTSGSTGDPKGVMLTHRNMLVAATSVSGYLGLRADDVIFCALPLAFDYGLYQILMAFRLGARVVLERSFAFPVAALELMARERATVFPGVPTLFSLLFSVKTLARYDLAALRLVTNTAAALPVAHIQRIRALFPQARLYSMYGLTECKRVSYLPPEELDRRPLSVGRGMPNQEVYLVDEQGRRLPPGSTGQLVVRGGHVMRGYWERPAETAACLRPGPYPGERVLYTGDLFHMDEEGYLYFLARGDDVIKSRGEKVAPKEVENALYALEGVREAAVVGVPDALLGEAIVAFVALDEPGRYTEKDLIQHCMSQLENHMVPKRVVLRDSLPKTDTGKIRKAELMVETSGTRVPATQQ